MSINKDKLSKYHFIATEIDFKIHTGSKKIIAGDWCNNYSSLENKNFEVAEDVSKDIISREKDDEFVKDIKNQYCEQLSLYLNKFNKENFPVNFWKILILSWLNNYLQTQLYRWRIVNNVLKDKKSISFFSFPDQDVYKCAIDTINYKQLIRSDNEFNYFHFKRILKYLKKKDCDISFIEKRYNKENVLKDFDIASTVWLKDSDSWVRKTKIYLLEFIDTISLFLSRKNDIFIDDKTFRKKDYLLINIYLRQFPTYLLKIFNWRLENRVFKKVKIDIEKRKIFNLNYKINNSNNAEFIDYINSSIIYDIPTCYLEGFSQLKESIKKIKNRPKLILSSIKHHHSEKFKFWVADSILNNNTKFITASHGAGDFKKFNPYFELGDIAHKRVTWAEPRNNKEIQLPANNFFNFKKQRKHNKYLSYADTRGVFFPERLTGKRDVQEFNLNNIKKFNFLLQKKIQKNLIYLPQEIPNWGSVFKIKDILKNNYINERASFKKYLLKSKIVVCGYLGTAFCESILTGPTILLYDLNSDPNNEKFDKIFQKLVKSKIAFSNPEDASFHINNIWDSVDKWWDTEEVKNTINEFIQQASPISNNPIKPWIKFLKKEVSSKD